MIKRKQHLTWTSCLAVAIALAAPRAEARIESLRLGGLAAFQASEFEGDLDGSGYELGAQGSLVLTRIGAVGVVGGLGLSRVGMDGDEGTSEIESATTAFGLMGGFEIPVTSTFAIQTLVQYDFGLSGSATITTALTKTQRDIDAFQRLSHVVQGLFELSNTMALAGGIGWFRGAMDLDNLTSDFDFKGHQFRASLLVKI